MKKSYRALALVAAILLLFAMLFSELFIICESGHDCSGDECPICAEIAICETFLRQIVLSVVTIVMFGAVLHYYFRGISAIWNQAHISTPVSLKVKLSD